MNSMPRSVSRTLVAVPGLVFLMLSAQSGGSCGASTRPRSRTVTSIRPLANCRVVSQLEKRWRMASASRLRLPSVAARSLAGTTKITCCRRYSVADRLGAALLQHALRDVLLAQAAFSAVARREQLAPAHLDADEFLEMRGRHAGLVEHARELLGRHLVRRRELGERCIDRGFRDLDLAAVQFLRLERLLDHVVGRHLRRCAGLVLQLQECRALLDVVGGDRRIVDDVLDLAGLSGRCGDHANAERGKSGGKSRCDEALG